MGKKSRKNASKLPTASAASASASAPAPAPAPNQGKHATSERTQPSSIGGIYADYISSMYTVLHHIAPHVSHSEPISKLVDAAKSLKATSRVIFEAVGSCLVVHRRLIESGYIDHQRLHFCTILGCLLLILEKRGTKNSLSERRPSSPTTVVHGLAEHSFSMKELLAAVRSERPDLNYISYGESTCTINDLLFGNDCFRVGIFFATLDLYSDCISSRWRALKQDMDHERRRRPPPPSDSKPHSLFQVMLVARWTESFCEQIKFLEKDITATYPYLVSVPSMLAVGLFAKEIQDIVTYGVDRIDAMGYVAEIIQAVIDEPSLLDTHNYNADSIHPQKVVRALKRHGVPRSMIKLMCRQVSFSCVSWVMQPAAFDRIRGPSRTLGVPYTYFLVQKSMRGCRVFGADLWDERSNPAASMAPDMSPYLMNVLVPSILNCDLSLLPSDSWQEGLLEDHSSRSLSSSFTIHSMLCSLFSIQGDDDVKAIAVSSKVAFLGKNKQFTQHRTKLERQPDALWNPYCAGLWCAKLIRDAGDGWLDEQIRLMMKLYNYLRGIQAVNMIPVFEILSQNIDGAHFITKLLFEAPGVLSKRDALVDAGIRYNSMSIHQCYLTLDMHLMAKLTSDFQDFLDNFFSHQDDSMERWFEKLSKEEETANEVGNCMYAHFTAANLELFH